MSTKGAIHKVTPEKLQQGAQEWKQFFSQYARPYHVVLLGGSTNRFNMTKEVMDDLIKQIKTIAETTDGSVLITPSFRTPYLDSLKRQLEPLPNVFLADLNVENPYLGMLGLADFLYITNDSVNMMCEANMTGKPLYLLIPKGHEGTVPAQFWPDSG